MTPKIMMGPNHSAIAVTPTLVLACSHATNFFTTASLLNPDGSPYLLGWKKEATPDGIVREVRACDFNFTRKSTEDDIDYCNPISLIPNECLTPLAFPAPGDDVVIESVRLGKSVSGKVEGIYGARAVCDFAAQPGDSGSLVWANTTPRRFVGFITAANAGKSSIAIPDVGMIGLLAQSPSTSGPVVSAPVVSAPVVPAPVVPAPVVPAPVVPAPVVPAPVVPAPAIAATDKAAAVRAAGEALAQAINGCTDGRAKSMALTHLELALLIVGNAVSPAPTLVAPQ